MWALWCNFSSSPSIICSEIVQGSHKVADSVQRVGHLPLSLSWLQHNYNTVPKPGPVMGISCVRLSGMLLQTRSLQTATVVKTESIPTDTSRPCGCALHPRLQQPLIFSMSVVLLFFKCHIHGIVWCVTF